MKKSITRKKPKKVNKSRSEIFIINHKYMGEEPTFKAGEELTQSQRGSAYNWYNYMCNREEARQYSKEWCEVNLQEMIPDIEKIPDKLFPPTAGWIMRLASRGYNMTKSLEFSKKLIIEQSVKVIEDPIESEEENSEEIKPVIVKDKIQDRHFSYVSQLEQVVDKEDWEHNVYSALQGNNFPVSCVSNLKTYYTRLSDELKIAVKGDDDQVNEAYRKWDKKNIKKASIWLESAIDDMIRYGQVIKKSRTPRKKKEQKIEKKLATFVYQRNSAEFKLESASAESTVGAQEILLFNTRYKTLVLLRALEGGIDIKGKSFKNFNEEKSLQIGTGRRTDKVLAAVMQGGKTTVSDYMRSKADPAKKVKSSSDENTIILRVFK